MFASAHQQQDQRQPRNYNPFSDIFGTSDNEAGEGGDDSDDDGDDEESVVRARREALAALDPYNANAHKEHFKSLKPPKQQQEHPEQENRVAVEDTIMPLSPPSRLATVSTTPAKDLESLEGTPTLIAVSTPPTSRTQHQKRDSLRYSLYSTPKKQIIQRPLSHDMTRQHNQDDDTLVPEISISLATPSPPPSASSNKHHHRRGSSLSNANPALLTTTFTPSPLSVLSPLDEEFDRVEATKKNKSNRSTAIYSNLFQRITSFGSLGREKGAEEEEEVVVDHIGNEMRKNPTAPKAKPISTSWSLKRNTFGTTNSTSNQSSPLDLNGKKKNKGSTKKSRKHGVAAVIDSLDPWDSCDDMLLQGTDDEDLYDDGAYGLSPSGQFLKGRMGGRRRSSDDATTTAESEQGVIPRLGKGAMAGMEDWMLYPHTAVNRGSSHKADHDIVPLPASAIASTATSGNRVNRQGMTRPVSSLAEYTTISLTSPPMTVYSSQALGGGQSAHDSTSSISLSRTNSLDSSFYRFKKGASKLLENIGGSTAHQSELAKGQAKKSQDYDEDTRVRQMMNGDHGDYGEQDLESNYHYYKDNDNEDEDADFSSRQHADQRSSSMTFGPRKAVSPPPLATFSSFPSLRDFIHSATGLSRSSTVPIGSSMGNISPPPFSPTAYLRRSQTTTASRFEGYADIQHGYSSSALSTSADGGRASFSPVSRRKNIPVMVPTIVVPKHIPGSGSTAALSATPVSFSPPLGSGSTTSSTTTVMTSSDDGDYVSMAAVAAKYTPTVRTFHRLGPSPPSSAAAPLTVPAKAATAANSTQLPSSLAAAAMAAAQRARAAYSQATTNTPVITLNRSNTSISVDSMTGPLMSDDYIGQFEKNRAQARNVSLVDEGPFGSMNRIDSCSSINTCDTTVNHRLPHHYHGSSTGLSYTPTSMSSIATLPVDLDGGHAKEMGKMTGHGVGNASVGFGSPLGFLRHLNYNINNGEEENNDTGPIRRTRQASAQSDISEKLMHLPEPSPFEGMCSCRGLVNITSMFLILCGLVLLILGYPIASSLKKDRLAAEAAAAAASAAVADGLTQVRFAIDSQHHHQPYQGDVGLMGAFSKTAASTVPRAPRSAEVMVDPDTPEEKKTTVAKDGQPWDLVFSDEFNQDSRGFGPGQDSHW
ncbi:hypothetical protein EC991_007900 [Linnemannia zychae]|nr:hypothetical protein EC991_007900 [Linnemannia zychae]